MFLRNKTHLGACLRHGVASEFVSLGTVIVETAYRIHDHGLERLEALPEAKPSDPPDTSVFAFWQGASVTCAGHALGPEKAPFVAPVILRVGDEVRRLIVFGDRHWEGGIGLRLSATPPSQFDAIEIAFERAYGGSFDLPPGLVPGTDLPHPGFCVSYAMNEKGMGHYLEERRALGNPLPNIERPDQLISRWNDQPVPAGFSACRELVGMRVLTAPEASDPKSFRDDAAALIPLALRMAHHAPGPLIFPRIDPGTRVSLEGLSGRRLAFAVPLPCVSVTSRTHRKTTLVPPTLRALHVDADAAVARFVHGFDFSYPEEAAPSWLRVDPQEAVA